MIRGRPPRPLRPAAVLVGLALACAACDSKDEPVDANRFTGYLTEPPEESPRDPNLAACETGNLRACLRAGRERYEVNSGALELCRSRVDAPCPPSITVELEEAAALFSHACDKGLAVACAYSGACFEAGHGVTADQDHALEHYAKACAAGDPLGCYAQGRLFASGHGGGDFPRALALYRKACGRDHARACAQAAELLRVGAEGVPRKPKQALEFKRRACELGDSLSCSL